MSSSGLDPHFSIANAHIQAERVADARGLPVEEVLRLVDEHTAGRALGFPHAVFGPDDVVSADLAQGARVALSNGWPNCAPSRAPCLRHSAQLAVLWPLLVSVAGITGRVQCVSPLQVHDRSTYS
jgi:hypothetical protein